MFENGVSTIARPSVRLYFLSGRPAVALLQWPGRGAPSSAIVGAPKTSVQSITNGCCTNCRPNPNTIPFGLPATLLLIQGARTHTHIHRSRPPACTQPPISRVHLDAAMPTGLRPEERSPTWALLGGVPRVVGGCRLAGSSGRGDRRGHQQRYGWSNELPSCGKHVWEPCSSGRGVEGISKRCRGRPSSRVVDSDYLNSVIR